MALMYAELHSAGRSAHDPLNTNSNTNSNSRSTKKTVGEEEAEEDDDAMVEALDDFDDFDDVVSEIDRLTFQCHRYVVLFNDLTLSPLMNT